MQAYLAHWLLSQTILQSTSQPPVPADSLDFHPDGSPPVPEVEPTRSSSPISQPGPSGQVLEAERSGAQQGTMAPP